MLQALMEYGQRLNSMPGFTTRKIRWQIGLTASGEFAVLPIGDGKSGQRFDCCPVMHNMNAGGRAHFLIEAAQTVVLLFKAGENKKNIEKVTARHKYFVALLDDASRDLPLISRIVDVLKDDVQRNAIRDEMARQGAQPADWVCWAVGSVDLRADNSVQRWWQQWRMKDIGELEDINKMRCFLTGELAIPIVTHPKISGLVKVGGHGAGDVVVGFDKAAFCSFGLEQSVNAAMGAEAVQRYADGLNDLIANHSRELANSMVVHWFKEKISMDNDPLAWLDGWESDDQIEAAAQSRARELLDAIRSGQRSDLRGNHYYAMTLSGASGRVMVRGWMEGSFEELAQNIKAWFYDLQIVACDGERLARDPKFNSVCLGLIRNDPKKSVSENLKQLPASAAASLWETAVENQPIPRALMAQALARFRADLLDKDQPAFNHARMGFIKAYFVRKTSKGDPTVTPHLYPDHPSSAYQCGRLLAVLANLQYAALGNVGAGVVQRYYSSVSQTPGLILGRLIANSRNHLGKLNGGLAFWYEDQIAAVMTHMGDGAPRTLDLEGQGLFALGYYQQLAAMRTAAKDRKIAATSETTGA